MAEHYAGVAGSSIRSLKSAAPGSLRLARRAGYAESAVIDNQLNWNDQLRESTKAGDTVISSGVQGRKIPMMFSSSSSPGLAKGFPGPGPVG